MRLCTKAEPSQTANAHQMIIKEHLLSQDLRPATAVMTTLYECPNCGLQAVAREAAFINRG